MSDQQSVATIEQRYADAPSQGVGAVSTTSPKAFSFEAEKVVPMRQPKLSVPDSPASLLHAYLEQVGSESASAIIEGGAGLGAVTEGFFLPPEPLSGGLRERREAPSRRERHATLIALLDEWLADESDYDEKTWPRLKETIEESRTSTRSRFDD